MSTYPDSSDCQRCDSARLNAKAAATGDDWWVGSSGMITCPTCGNKRCPKATWHENECTNSNEPNQPGSSYQTCTCTWGSDPWGLEPQTINPACAAHGTETG